MSDAIELPTTPAIPPYGSEEALRKESHVARFLEREYLSLQKNPVSLEDAGIDPTAGPMSEQTANLMETHYDQELFLFSSFLDDYYMAYTMAYYGVNEEEVFHSSFSIEDAQAEKFRLICERAGIQGNERILNIGCGFGAFERYLLENYSEATIIGVTPSEVQSGYILDCCNNSDHIFHDGRFEIIKTDFDSLLNHDIPFGSFDMVVSVGLVDAIKNLRIFNERVAQYLKPGGTAFHHVIVSKSVIPQFLNSSGSLIGEYFPGGRVWPLDELPRHAGPLRFERSWFINGMNYWKTLDEWHKKFWQNMDSLQGRLSAEELAYWSDYFILCKACFRPLSGTVFGNGHYLFTKPE